MLTQRLPDLRLVPGQTLSYFPSATATRLESLELAWDAPWSDDGAVESQPPA